MPQTLHPSTELIHHPYQPPAGFSAPQPAVHKASSIFLPSMAAARQRSSIDKTSYTYGTHGTPTTFTLEQRLCTLEGGTHCLLLPSGLASIACINMALLEPGDEVLLPDNVYGPNKTLAEAELKRWGISHQYYNPTSTADLAAKISPATKLVWLEAAGSLTLEFPDLPAMVQLCRQRGILTALDNTWGAGLAYRPFDLLRTGNPATALGVDITAHALTKYPNGAANVLMGSIITRDEALYEQLALCHMRMGFCVGINDVETILQNLPSIALRYAASDRNARAVAQWCAQQKQFIQVLHPALPTSPGHAHWQALCCTAEQPQGAAAGIVSVIFDDRYTQAQIDTFCESLRLFKLGYSWAGPVSLVMAYDLNQSRNGWPEHLQRGKLVRLCTGLENADDLIADLQQALAALPA
ncbi:MAG: PLP-dependent transferase [Brachymonas sp.]|mgnify:FL=1|nr:PLP-dependent transferase [Brachymonas sp.]MBP6966759.1 PLP-dependent transferase [Brachymonas sp.]MBP7247292.1 PLP-dependent transferase [Brachymonas sp.]MBP7740316.1 PLP-dependent transferase [Brachymonas sp.]MBP8596871.1 PLP-dependent transferase [Brachymonas sp.]